MTRMMTLGCLLMTAVLFSACGEQGTYNTAVNPDLAALQEENAAQLNASEALEGGTYRIPVDAAKDVLLAHPELLTSFTN